MENFMTTKNEKTNRGLLAQCLVQPLGAQLMEMEQEKRRCPQCLGMLEYHSGCQDSEVPYCGKCKGFMPRGGKGYWIITTDENGVVNGTAKPELIDGEAYLENFMTTKKRNESRAVNSAECEVILDKIDGLIGRIETGGVTLRELAGHLRGVRGDLAGVLPVGFALVEDADGTDGTDGTYDEEVGA